MGSAAAKLFGLAVACAIIGVGLVAATAEASDAAGVWALIVGHAEGAFAPAAWAWLLRAAVVASAVALVLTGLEVVLGIRRPAKPIDFGETASGNVRQTVDEVHRRVEECTNLAKPNVVSAFHELLRGAVKIGASDIHMSPTPEGFKLTYRVQGTLHDVIRLDSSVAPPLVTRVKVLARLDTYIRNAPQDGRLVAEVDGRTLQARVSTLPTEVGERVVLRLVRGTRSIPEVEELGFADEVHERLVDTLASPQGLFLVTGPVGSGKTTTLYAALQHIAKTRGTTTSLVTLEDPIELELPFATQTQMHERAGMTFASTLRSVLRQDPNVLMVGEIRDRETTEIAMQSGLSGHLILTTVHAESAAGPFARLMDLGVEPYALASGTVGSLSQRLVRTLCTACRREAKPEPHQIERFSKHGIVLPDGPFYEPVGCDFCEGEGFTGRTPIAELLVVNSSLREAITAQKTTSELHDLAVAEGMTPLLRDGLVRAQQGVTSLAEVLRVAG